MEGTGQKDVVNIFLALSIFFFSFFSLLMILTTLLGTQRGSITTRSGQINAEQGTGRERDAAEGGKVLHAKKRPKRRRRLLGRK